MVELTCSTCRRTLKQAEDVVVERLKQGKAIRCLVCAKVMTLPTALQAKLDAPPPPPVVRRMGKCPVCLEPAIASGQLPILTGLCTHCSIPFTNESLGHGSFDVPVDAPADLAEVEAACARLAPLPMGSVLSLALRKRCERGSLAVNEATRLAHMHEGLAKWRPSPGVPLLPWAPDEVKHLVGPFIIHSSHVSFDEERDLIYLQNELMIDAGSTGMGMGTKVALNTVGIGLLLATGNGFTVGGGAGRAPEVLTQEYWVRLHATPDGCIFEVASSQNKSPPQAMSPAEQGELANRLVGLRRLLERYARALVLCTAHLRGARSRRFVAEAALQRLVDIGMPGHQAQKFAGEFVLGTA